MEGGSIVTRRFIAVLLVAICCVALVGATPAAASPFDDLSDDDEPDGLLERAQNAASVVIAAASGLVDRAMYTAGSVIGDDPDAASDANATLETFNQHNESIRTYLNNRSAADPAYQVLEVEFVHGDDSETIYIVAKMEANETEYSSIGAVQETDREVDESITLEGFAAASASDELEFAVGEFVEPNESVNESYRAELVSKYWKSVETSFEI